MWAEVDVSINLLNQDSDELNYIRKNFQKTSKVFYSLFDVEIKVRSQFYDEGISSCSEK